MSLREKQLWVSLVVGAVVWIAYAWRILALLRAPDTTVARDAGIAFLLALVVTIVVEAALSAVPAWLQRRNRPAQEDALTQAALVAGHVALMVLIGLIALVVVGLWATAVWTERSGSPFFSSVDLPRAFVVVANLLVGCVVLAEGARTILTLALVRRR